MPDSPEKDGFTETKTESESMEDTAMKIGNETEHPPQQESEFKNKWIDAYSDCV